MKKRSLLEVLSENLRTYMNATPELNSDRKLSKVSGVSHKTINNILAKRHDVQMSNVEKLARAFRIETFQLLCPSSEESFLSVCKAFADTDDRGRELLTASAEMLIKQHERRSTKTGQAVG